MTKVTDKDKKVHSGLKNIEKKQVKSKIVSKFVKNSY